MKQHQRIWKISENMVTHIGSDIWADILNQCIKVKVNHGISWVDWQSIKNIRILKKEIDYWLYGKVKVPTHLLLMIIRAIIGIWTKTLNMEILKEFGLTSISVTVVLQVKQLVLLNTLVKNHNQSHLMLHMKNQHI